MLVQQILNAKASTDVMTVAPGTLVRDAAQILAEKRIGTVRELAAHGAGCLAQKVDDYMTTKLVTCTRADTADEVLRQMTEGRFRHMPVVEEGKLVGLITLGDTVKARLSELAMEKDALEGMIMGH